MSSGRLATDPLQDTGTCPLPKMPFHKGILGRQFLPTTLCLPGPLPGTATSPLSLSLSFTHKKARWELLIGLFY